MKKKFTDVQIEVLKEIYIECDVPIDRFIYLRDILKALVDLFNKKVGGNFTPEEIHALMIKLRKQGEWPRIRRKYDGRKRKGA